MKMKQKWPGVCAFAMLTLILLCVSCGANPTNTQTAQPAAAEHTEATGTMPVTPTPEHCGDYFRDNTEYAGEYTQICYAMAPYAESRDFSDLRAALEAANIIPALPGYEDFGCTACYLKDSGFYEIHILWRNFPEEGIRKQLELLVIPETLSDEESLRAHDGAFIYDPEMVTETEVNGITVYGSGTQALTSLGNDLVRNNTLVFTKNGWRYQIDGCLGTTLEEMDTVLNHFLQQGLDETAFAMEKGDHFTSEYLYENPNAFPGCLPDAETFGLRMENGLTYILKNGDPYSYECTFRDPGTDACFSWLINPAEQTSDPLCSVAEVTEAEFRAALTETHRIEGHHITLTQGDFHIRLISYDEEVPVDLMWKLVSSLPKIPEETPDFFGNNTVLSGELSALSSGNSNESRFFDDQQQRLIAEQALPPVLCQTDCTQLPYEFHSGCDYSSSGAPVSLSFTWYDTRKESERSALSIKLFSEKPQALEKNSYGILDRGIGGYFIPDPLNCTTIERQGVSVYGDGTRDSDTRYLCCQLKDGTWLQIEGAPILRDSVMLQALDFYLEHGMNWDAVSMDKGDVMTSEELSLWADAFPGCIPEVEEGKIVQKIKGTDFRQTSAVASLKNGQLHCGLLNYQIKDDQILVKLWPAGHETDVSPGYTIDQVTDTHVQYNLQNSNTFGFWIGDTFVEIRAMNWDEDAWEEVWKLIQTFPTAQ